LWSDLSYVLNTKLVQNFLTTALTKISALVPIPTESYAIFSPVLLAVQTVSQNVGKDFFEQMNIQICSWGEYQSCAKYGDEHAHQNSAFLHKGTESYENLGEPQPAPIGFFRHVNFGFWLGVEYQLWSLRKSTSIDQKW
jgi:hypothetical protein